MTDQLQRKVNPNLIGISALSVLAVGGLLYYLHSRHFEATDDANVEAHVTAISPNISGTVVKVHVADNQTVQQGDPLVQIDPRPFEARLGQARAEMQAADAEALRARSDLERYEKLFKQDAISQQQLDHAVAASKAAEAKLELARKKVAADELDVSYAKITAPLSGRVARRSVEEGAYVQVGQALMAIVPEHVWIIANFKETQLTDMKPGQDVAIKIDAYPGKKFYGKVDSIQRGTGSRFSLLPAENATGNFVKVVQRVPVKIVFDPAPGPEFLMAPGMSVEPKVRVR